MAKIDTKVIDKKKERLPMLVERERVYGNFKTQAALAMTLSTVINRHTLAHPSVDRSSVQTLALQMIIIKISRLVNGNPNDIDSWRDIAGYATLVVEDLEF